MAISLASLKSRKADHPPMVLLDGVGGIGKTSLAAEWPAPLHLLTVGECPPSDIGMATPGNVGQFGELLDIFGELLTTKHEYRQ
jgi:hypothetical protein